MSDIRKRGLTKGIRYFYGIGDMCYTLMTYVYSYYQLYYLTNVAQLSFGTAAVIMTTCSAIDVATAMVAGGIINSTRPMKWGRYRSWLVVITWMIPAFYFFMYFRVSDNDTITMLCLMAAMLIGRFLHDFPCCASTSLISVVAVTEDDRLAMASSKATWNSAAKFVWSFTGVPLLAVLTALFSEKYSYALLAFVMAGFMVVGYWIHFKLTEGYEDTGAEELANEAKAKRAKTGLVDLIKALFANPPLLALVIADLAKWLFNFMVASSSVYYFTYVTLNQGMLGMYTLIVAFMGIIGAFLSRYIGRELSGRLTMIVSYIIMGCCLILGRMFYQNVWIVIAMLAVAQLFYGCVYSCSTVLYADTAVYSEWKTGKNASGWIMGLTIVPLNIASMLKGIILPIVLAAGGFSAAVAAEEASEAMRKGIANTLMVVPAVMLFLGAFVLVFSYRLTKDRVAQMQKEIDEKKLMEAGGDFVQF